MHTAVAGQQDADDRVCLRHPGHVSLVVSLPHRCSGLASGFSQLPPRDAELLADGLELRIGHEVPRSA